MIGQRVTTTSGEAFELEDIEVLAALVYKRFGWDKAGAAAAWRRMLGNSCPDTDFEELAIRAIAHVRSNKHRVAKLPIQHPIGRDARSFYNCGHDIGGDVVPKYCPVCEQEGGHVPLADQYRASLTDPRRS